MIHKTSVYKIIELFFTFLKIGCITFGGGYSIITILDRQLIRKRAWTTMDELTECYAIAQITPGVIALNVSTFIGCKRCGVIGGIIATIAFIIPGALSVILIAIFLQQFSDLEIVRHAFSGIRLTVGALILGTILKLIKVSVKKEAPVFHTAASIIICIICFVLSFFFKTNPVFLVAAAGIIGAFIFRKSTE